MNVTVPGYDDKDLNVKIEKVVEPQIFDKVRDLKGSVSAEHGVGLSKQAYLSHSKSKEMIEYMIQVKKMFYPYGIMNPYKVVPNAF